MTENHEPVESIEDPAVGEPFTDAEIADFMARGGEAPSYHPILQVWREVLGNADGELTATVTPQWANRITSSYREINFRDMEKLRDALFGKVLELASVLETVIESDEDCLTYTTPEEDVEYNSKHYRDLLMHWQLILLDWELSWRCTDENAAVELAAISEVHKMFFSQTGITAFLDNIKFEFNEADQAELAAALEAKKEGR